MPEPGPSLQTGPFRLGLTIPAQAEFLGVVRLAVAGLCHRLDIPPDRGEDLKMAVDEACSYCIQTLPALERIAIRFEMAPDRLCVRLLPQPTPGPLVSSEESPPLGLILMEALVDTVERLEKPAGLQLTVNLSGVP
ncbi:MAG: ATP-binding protein [Candidatus Xenobium sp.]|nr:hypothetical protein [Burkholderiales bacterium]